MLVFPGCATRSVSFRGLWVCTRHVRRSRLARNDRASRTLLERSGGPVDVLQTLLVGLAAGAIGTVVFTIVEYLEMAVTGRPASLVPGQVLVALTGGDPQAEKDRAKKYNLPVHFMHGTALGVVLAALSLLDLSAVLTTVIFFVLLLSGDWMMYVLLGVTRPWRWSAADMARELLLKAFLAAAIGVAFYMLIELI